MNAPLQSPSFEVRCPACHVLLIQVEGTFTRLLGAVKVECRRCGKRRWLRPDPVPTETAQDTTDPSAISL